MNPLQTKILCIMAVLLFISAGPADHSGTEIQGRYYRYFTPGKDGWSDYYLTIKGKGMFTELLIVHMHGKKKKITTAGNWILRRDTVFLFPVNVKTSNGKRKFNCSDQADDVFCRPDTFIYKDSALWSTWPFYKEYTRRK
jgi:hypothetical protein